MLGFGIAAGTDDNRWLPIMVVAGLVAAILIYFLPAVIAEHRKHGNLQSIRVVNVLLGWTLIGWVFSLAWALSTPTDSSGHP